MRDLTRFTAKFAESMVTTWSCVDRLIFKGYLPFGGSQQLRHGRRQRVWRSMNQGIANLDQ